MRTDTKLAIVVAVVCIVFGAWYITSGPETSTPTAQETPETPPPADTVAESKPDAPAAPPRIVHKPDPKPSEPATAARPPRPEPVERPAAPEAESTQAEAPVAMAEAPGLEQDPEPVASLPPIELPAGPPIDPVPLPRAEGVGLADGPALPASSDTPEPAAAGTAQPSVTETASDAEAPTVAEAPQAPESKPAFTEHTIQSGDTYSSLAVQYLGHARHANRIAEANPTLEARRLRVGAVVKIPASDEQPVADAGASAAATASPAPAARAPQAAPIPTERSYEVKPGEGWYTLAERFLGNGTRWTELYELNKGRVPTNFNILPAGTTIELPPGIQITQ